jgi:hypothetical protein
MLSNGSRFGSATGFFYEQSGHLWLVTARHILDGMDGKAPCPDALQLELHGKDLNDMVTLKLPLLDASGKRLWHAPKDKNADFAILQLDRNQIDNYLFSTVAELLPIDSTPMIGQHTVSLGFPHGSGDAGHSLPFIYSANLASAYGVPFNNKPWFYIDRALLPGMSGCPILTRGPVRALVNGKPADLDQDKFYLLGIHNGTAKTDEESKKLDTSSGVYAHELKQLVDDVSKNLPADKPK